MRQSQLFTKTLREPPKDEEAANARLLVQAGFIDKLMAGVYSFLPLGLRVLKKIEHIILDEMNKAGGEELVMPALHPLENYLKTKRDKIDVLFHLGSVTGKQLVLGQSHEEVIVPLVKKHVSSYKDLPLAVYQIQTKFRNELRAKSGIFRGVEFLMKDLYSFHRDEKDFEKYYEKMKKVYFFVFRRAGISPDTYLTYASGGTFSRYSHEFQTLTSAGEDTIHLCEKCRIAVNEEIINETKKCPSCGAAKLRQERAIEVGNIFSLKTRFSDAFGLTYKNEHGINMPIVMGCYGIGLTRLMGAIVEKHHDECGIIWPDEVAPFRVHLIALESKVKGKRSKVHKAVERLYEELLAKGVEVLYDDRDYKSPGEKFADTDLIGIPWRAVISEKTLEKNGIEIKKRDSTKSEVVTFAHFLKGIAHRV